MDSQRIRMLKLKIAAKKEAAELVQIGLEPIREKLDFIEGKLTEYWKTYCYWLNYNHPTMGVSNASIRESYAQWESMLNERKELLARVGLRTGRYAQIEVIV